MNVKMTAFLMAIHLGLAALYFCIFLSPKGMILHLITSFIWLGCVGLDYMGYRMRKKYA